MKLLGIDLRRSPLSRDRVRLSGRVRYRSGDPREESLWFEVPEELEPEVSRSGDPWLVVLLPVPATLGEDLVLPLPVNPVLRSGCRDVARVWQGGYGGLSVPDLMAPVEERGSRAGEPRSWSGPSRGWPVSEPSRRGCPSTWSCGRVLVVRARRGAKSARARHASGSDG